LIIGQPPFGHELFTAFEQKAFRHRCEWLVSYQSVNII